MLFVLMLPSLIFGGLTSSGNAGQPIVNDNSFIAQYRAAKAWGLNVEGCTASEPQRILDALSDGKLVVAIMTKGHFTSGGHFIVLRGVQDGQILVADPASYRWSDRLWAIPCIFAGMALLY